MLKCNELKNKWFPELIAFILWDTKWPLELSGSKNLDRERLEQIQPLSYLLFIHYFRIDHNAPCLPPRILYNYSFQFLLGVTVVSREIQDNG